jgi:hypothetical protein
MRDGCPFCRSGTAPTPAANQTQKPPTGLQLLALQPLPIAPKLLPPPGRRSLSQPQLETLGLCKAKTRFPPIMTGLAALFILLLWVLV